MRTLQELKKIAGTFELMDGCSISANAQDVSAAVHSWLVGVVGLRKLTKSEISKLTLFLMLRLEESTLTAMETSNSDQVDDGWRDLVEIHNRSSEKLGTLMRRTDGK